MEGILDTYKLPYKEELPVVCMDEKPYQLLDQVLSPLQVKPGSIRKEDAGYKRKGPCSIFVFTQPLADYRHTSVRKTRTMVDWAQEIEYLLTVIYTVSLTEEERKTIHKLLNENTLSISLRKRANILLLSDQSVGTPMKQKEIALRCDVNVATVSRTVCDFSLHGLQQALTFKRTKATNPTIVTGEIEANVIALACSQPPDGFSKWSVRLLTQKVIELQIFETVSRETVRRILKNTA